MKIVNLSYKYFPEKDPKKWIEGFGFFYGIWEEMAKRDEVIYIHFIDFEGSITHRGVRHLFLRQSAPGLFFPFLLNRRVGKELKPDVVVVHGLMFPLQVLLLKLQLGRSLKIVVQHHADGPPGNRLKKMAQRMADRYINAYFFTGKGLAQRWLGDNLISDSTKVKEIMEVSSVFTPIPQNEARQCLGIGEGDMYIWVGHLNANKNPLLVVRAFIRFVANHNNNASLYLVFQSNSLLGEIENLLRQNPKEAKQIKLVGKLPHENLQTWFSAADFVISSSYYEGSGVAVCEGMSCGCIPILTDIPSFRFMAGNAGFLYESGNEDALVTALIESTKADKVQERKKTLQQYHQHLSFEAIAKEIQDVLSGL